MTRAGTNDGYGEQGSWGGPGGSLHGYPGPATLPPEASGEQQGRPGRIALVAFLVELVVIAAACNQGLYRHEIVYAGNHADTFLGRAVGSLLLFAWRVSPRRGDNTDGFHDLWSHLTTIGVFLVLTVLLTLAVARGAVTFGRVFVGVWTSVIASACAAAAIGSLVTKSFAPAGYDRATNAVFVAVNGSVVFIGAALGLVVALVAAVVAVSSRRTVAGPAAASQPAGPPPPPPEPPPPYYGEGPYARTGYPSGPPADPRADYATTALPSLAKDDSSSTAQLPVVDAPSDPYQRDPYRPDQGRPDAPPEPNRTTQIPRFDPQGGQTWSPPTTGQGGGSTQAFPLPHNDEDLDHRPD